MNLKESIQYHCEQLKEVKPNSHSDTDVDEIVEDVLNEHPNVDQAEIEESVRSVLGDLYDE